MFSDLNLNPRGSAAADPWNAHIYCSQGSVTMPDVVTPLRSSRILFRKQSPDEGQRKSDLL